MSQLAVTKILDLKGKAKTFYNYAQKAVQQRNYGYAVEMFASLLEEEPGCEEVRIQLRICQVEKVKAGLVSGSQKFINSLMSSIILPTKGSMLNNGNKFKEALALCEKYLSVDPYNVATLTFFSQVADKAGLLKSTEQALKLCYDSQPDNIAFIQAMIDFYQKNEDKSGALNYMQIMAKKKPNDMSLQNELKQATAAATMQRDNWSSKSDYRDIMKSKEEASINETLEKANIHDDEAAASMIEHFEKQVEESPTTSNYKRLSDLYKQKCRWEDAIKTYRKTLEIMGTLDPNIDDAITDCIMGQYKDSLGQWDDYLKANQDKEEEILPQIEAIKEQRDETLFERYRERAERYPNDSMYRFTVAELYYKRAMYDEAVKEYQASLKNPQFRGKSSLGLGHCLVQKGMFGMAIEQFEQAKKEMSTMDATKKDVLYTLANAYLSVNNEEKAMENFKVIYFADSNYRDVSEKLAELDKKQMQ